MINLGQTVHHFVRKILIVFKPHKITGKIFFYFIEKLEAKGVSKEKIIRFSRFVVVGFSGLFVDMTTFGLFREVINLSLTKSTIFSTELAIINTFFWNDLWTFADISQQQKSFSKKLKRFVKYNIVCLSGVILQVLILHFLVRTFGINEYLAKFMAIVIVTFWNFWFNLKFSWGAKKKKGKASGRVLK